MRLCKVGCLETVRDAEEAPTFLFACIYIQNIYKYNTQDLINILSARRPKRKDIMPRAENCVGFAKERRVLLPTIIRSLNARTHNFVYV